MDVGDCFAAVFTSLVTVTRLAVWLNQAVQGVLETGGRGVPSVLQVSSAFLGSPEPAPGLGPGVRPAETRPALWPGPVLPWVLLCEMRVLTPAPGQAQDDSVAEAPAWAWPPGALSPASAPPPTCPSRCWEAQAALPSQDCV